MRAEVKVRLRDTHLINASLIIAPAASLGVPGPTTPHSEAVLCVSTACPPPRAVSVRDELRIIRLHCKSLEKTLADEAVF